MASDTAEDHDKSPAERRRRRVRDQIVEAAEAIFAEEGEAGLSMRRIAERIDYSPAALYKYFDSKEALFDEIREQFFERLLMRMRAVRAELTDGPALNHACLRAYVETGLEQPSHYRLAFAAPFGTDGPDEGSFGLAAATHLEHTIAESIEGGWFVETDPGEAASAVWASAHGLTMLAVTVPGYPHKKPGCESLTLDDVVGFQALMIMRGLATEKLRAFLDARGAYFPKK